MAYGRRSSSRRKGRRGNRTLSTRRIFNNKGARAQARQINALKRRINRVYSRTKPEVKVVETNRTEYMVTSSPESSVLSFDFVQPSLGAAGDQRIGTLVRMVQPTLFISGKYDAVTASSAVPMYNTQLLKSGAAVRIIAIQSKIAQDEMPSINSILHNDLSQSYQGIDNIANLRIPFEVGITSRYAIIYDKVKYFSLDKPIFSKRINFKPKIRTLKWDAPTTSASDEGYRYAAGQIFVYIIQGGLESNNVNVAAEGNDYTRITLSYSQKLAYTDA